MPAAEERHFILMRHADYLQPQGVPSAHLLYPLSEKGQGQAKEAGEALLGLCRRYSLKIGPRLYCSSLLRAYQTAMIVAGQLNQEFQVVQTPDLMERSTGAANNLTVGEIEDILDADPRYSRPKKGWKSERDYRLPFPGAESLKEAGGRVFQFVSEKVSASQPGEVTVFIGHGASIRSASVEMGLLSVEDLKKYSMHNAVPMLFKMEKGQWLQVEGDWKVRKPSEGND